MKHINELEKKLSNLFNWHKSRIGCLARIIQALFLVKTVNLSEIANSFHNKAKEKSSYRRVQRFFKSFSFDLSSVGILVLSLFSFEKYILIMDRTNWKWGKTHINIQDQDGKPAIYYAALYLENRLLTISMLKELSPEDSTRCLSTVLDAMGDTLFHYLVRANQESINRFIAVDRCKDRQKLLETENSDEESVVEFFKSFGISEVNFQNLIELLPDAAFKEFVEYKLEKKK